MARNKFAYRQWSFNLKKKRGKNSAAELYWNLSGLVPQWLDYYTKRSRWQKKIKNTINYPEPKKAF